MNTSKTPRAKDEIIDRVSGARVEANEWY
jgi:hypothetical protein